MIGIYKITNKIFQSTLPVRGATQIHCKLGFSTDISIHAPREGSDPERIGAPAWLLYFNPRSP